MIVNAAGSTVAADGSLYGARFGLGDEFSHLRTPAEKTADDAGSRAPSRPLNLMNTVIAVLATDVPLDKAAATRMAVVAHDGLARVIDPTHTLVDGDTIFSVSTRGEDDHRPRLSVTDPAALERLETVFAAGVRTLCRAVVHGMLAAETVETPAGVITGYRDAYPSAFRTA